MTRRDWWLLLALMIAVTVIALPILTYPPGRDQGEFATIGRGLLEGKVPYVDLWNPKPPTVFYIYALAMALFGQTAQALRALDLLMVPVIGAALYWLGWRVSDETRVGLFTAVMFAAFYFTETFWTLTQNDGLVLLPMTLAMVCLFKASDEAGSRHGLLWAFGAGALSAWAVWFKYPFALFGLVIIVGYVIVKGLNPALSTQHSALFSDRFKSYSDLGILLAFLAGGLLVVAVGVAYLASLGAMDDLLLSAGVTSQYTALTFNPVDFAELMRTAIGFRWHHWGLLWVLVGLWFVVGRTGQRRGRAWGVIVLWAVVGLAIMLVQAKGYDYHWLPMLPPLALMGADTLDRLIDLAAHNGLAKRSQVPATFLVVALFLVVMWQGIWPKSLNYLRGLEDQVAYYGRFQAGEFVADESLVIANILQERTEAGDSLYIWGFRPEVYFMSDLRPATRFIFHFPLVAPWYPQDWRRENVDTLWAALPPYVLVLQVDYMPWVTGRDEDSNTLLQEYNALNDWLIFNYEREVQIGNFFLWRRKTM